MKVKTYYYRGTVPEKIFYFIVIFVYVLLSHSFSLAGITSCSDFDYTPSDEEHLLHELINQYRQENGLPAIELSKSLTYVARTHVSDLQSYPPSGNCNLHSWSQYGEWSACCYTPDHAQASCVWVKPQELTPYIGYGYEIAAWSSMNINANTALSLWQSSPPHNDVILNQGIWNNYPWSSIGTGIYGNYAVVWFGVEEDICGYFDDALCSLSFNDVPNGYWAEDYITAIACNSITTGCGGENYCPNNNVNRAQMAAFIIRAVEGEPIDNYCGTSNPFSDVSYNHWACKYIKRLSELGITGGCGGNNYCPANIVTRSQMAAFIIRALYGETYSYNTSPYFSDISETHWAFKYIQKMKDEGITTGCTLTTYCPNSNVTRDQMAAFLSRAFLGME